jgi:hypothetical protein
MGIGRKVAVSLVVGLAALMAIALKASGEGLGRVARSPEARPVDCNINDAFFPCFAPQWGFEGLFIWDPH